MAGPVHCWRLVSPSVYSVATRSLIYSSHQQAFYSQTAEIKHVRYEFRDFSPYFRWSASFPTARSQLTFTPQLVFYRFLRAKLQTFVSFFFCRMWDDVILQNYSSVDEELLYAEEKEPLITRGSGVDASWAGNMRRKSHTFTQPSGVSGLFHPDLSLPIIRGQICSGILADEISQTACRPARDMMKICWMTRVLPKLNHPTQPF